MRCNKALVCNWQLREMFFALAFIVLYSTGHLAQVLNLMLLFVSEIVLFPGFQTLKLWFLSFTLLQIRDITHHISVHKYSTVLIRVCDKRPFGRICS